MGTLPNTRQAQLEFCESHVGKWGTNPAAIGLTPAMITSLTALTSGTRETFDDATAARQTSKAATNSFYTSSNSLRAATAAPARSEPVTVTPRIRGSSIRVPIWSVLANMFV